MPSQENSDFKELVFKANNHKKNGLPFVLYRKPNESGVKAIFSNKKGICHSSDFSKTGFVFSPFDSSKKPLLFVADTIQEVTYKIQNNVKVGIASSIGEGKEKHLNLVSDAVSTIKSGPLKKVVLSREIVKETQKSGLKIFQDVLDTYPTAFNYILFHPKEGMWIGATPETLLILSNNTVSTNSLAGTLPVIDKNTPIWGKKELQEQQIVTDYIFKALKGKITDTTVTDTASVKAGKLWHLKSIVSGKLVKNANLGSVITSLHPTPAVCGLPKGLAKKFIAENENYDREYYTGFLGELNFGIHKNTELYVNLRCMKLINTKATIYVGGGITKDSVANKEWEETQYKSKTMLNLL